MGSRRLSCLRPASSEPRGPGDSPKNNEIHTARHGLTSGKKLIEAVDYTEELTPLRVDTDAGGAGDWKKSGRSVSSLSLSLQWTSLRHSDTP